MGISYLGLAECNVYLDNLLLAESYIDKCLKASSIISDKLTIADSYRIRALIQQKLKNYSIAEILFLTSIRVNNQYKNDLNVAESQLALALMYKETNNLLANEYLIKSLKYFEKIEFSKEVSLIKNLIA